MSLFHHAVRTRGILLCSKGKKIPIAFSGKAHIDMIQSSDVVPYAAVCNEDLWVGYFEAHNVCIHASKPEPGIAAAARLLFVCDKNSFL